MIIYHFFWHSVCFSNIYQLHISYSYCILHLSSLRVFHHFFDCEKKHNKSMESRSKKPSLVPLLVFRTPFSQRISLKKKSQVSFHWASTSCLWSARETWAVSNQSSLKKGRHQKTSGRAPIFFSGKIRRWSELMFSMTRTTFLEDSLHSNSLMIWGGSSWPKMSRIAFCGAESSSMDGYQLSEGHFETETIQMQFAWHTVWPGVRNCAQSGSVGDNLSAKW